MKQQRRIQRAQELTKYIISKSETHTAQTGLQTAYNNNLVNKEGI